MVIKTIIPDKSNTSDTFFFTLSAPGTIVGATVSAVVFTTLSTTGEIVASITGTGIELSGNVLAYGTEIIGGTLAGNSIRTVARTYGALAKPAISNSSRIGALGISVLAGTGAALTTSALVYGGKQIGSYLYYYYEQYTQNIINKIQHPVPFYNDILLIEDDIQLIKEEPENNIEMSVIESKHSQQD